MPLLLLDQSFTKFHKVIMHNCRLKQWQPKLRWNRISLKCKMVKKIGWLGHRENKTVVGKLWYLILMKRLCTHNSNQLKMLISCFQWRLKGKFAKFIFWLGLVSRVSWIEWADTMRWLCSLQVFQSTLSHWWHSWIRRATVHTSFSVSTVLFTTTRSLKIWQDLEDRWLT